MKELIERARCHAERLERGDDFYRDEISDALTAMVAALERAETMADAVGNLDWNNDPASIGRLIEAFTAYRESSR